MRLNKGAIDAIAPNDKDAFYWDDALRGFGLKVKPRGRKVFVLQTRLQGQPKRFTIGVFGQPWTPDKARSDPLRLLGVVAEGRDPNKDKKSRPPALTMAQRETYFSDACVQKKAATVRHEQGEAKRHIIPLLGKLDVAAVTKANVQNL